MPLEALKLASDESTEVISIDGIIEADAARYHVSADELRATLSCESQMDIEAVGDEGTSFGIAQIHLPAHPDITEAESDDPSFAIAFMARQFSIGNAKAWTCARMLGFAK